MSKYSLLIEKFLKKSIIIISSLVLIFFLYISSLTTPQADDFRGLTNNQIENSFKQSVYNSYKYYINWEGRYTHYFLVYYLPSLYYKLGITDDQVIVKAQAFLTLFFFIITLFLILTLFFKEFKIQKHLVFSSIFLSYFFLNFSSMADSLFWFTGSIGYGVGFILMLLIIYLKEKYLKNNNYLLLLLLAFLIFFISGLTIIFSIFIIIYFFTNLVFDFYQKNSFKKEELLLMIISFLSFLLIFLAPGNYIRSSTTLDSFDWNVLSIFIGLDKKHGIVLDYPRNIFLTSYGLSSLIFSILLAVLIIQKKEEINKHFVIRFLVFIFLSSIFIQLFFNIAFNSHFRTWTLKRTFSFFNFISPFLFLSFLILFLNLNKIKILIHYINKKSLINLIYLFIINLIIFHPSIDKIRYTIENKERYKKRYENVMVDLKKQEIKINKKNCSFDIYFEEKNWKYYNNNFIFIPFSDWKTYGVATYNTIESEKHGPWLVSPQTIQCSIKYKSSPRKNAI